MNENEFWVLFWTVTMLSACALVLGGGAIYTKHLEAMADRGYVEQAVPGRIDTIWVKP